MHNGGLSRSSPPVCGVRPQAQNTGSSSSATSPGSPTVLITPSKVRRRCSGIADMNRRAVNIGKARGDLDGADRIGRLEGAHRHHQGCRETARPATVSISVLYIDSRDVVALEGICATAVRPRSALPRTRTSSRARRSRDRRANGEAVSVLLGEHAVAGRRDSAEYRCGYRDRRRA